MAKSKSADPDFHRFESGAIRIPPSPKGTLKSELTKLGIKLRTKRHYTRSQKQMDDAKIVRDRIMGERDA